MDILHYEQASFSADTDGPDGRGMYRFTLFRKWNMQHDLVASQGGAGFDRTGQSLMVIGLNPSTADEVKDDPTIRRCKDFAARWGFGGLVMTNLFAFRATKPEVMKTHKLPEGDPVNLRTIEDQAEHAGLILCAWGNHGDHRARNEVVLDLLRGQGERVVYLRLTKPGHPEHPLYVPAETIPTPIFK